METEDAAEEASRCHSPLVTFGSFRFISIAQLPSFPVLPLTFTPVYTPCLATLNPYGTGVKRPRTKDEEGERLDREGLEERIPSLSLCLLVSSPP